MYENYFAYNEFYKIIWEDTIYYGKMGVFLRNMICDEKGNFLYSMDKFIEITNSTSQKKIIQAKKCYTGVNIETDIDKLIEKSLKILPLCCGRRSEKMRKKIMREKKKTNTCIHQRYIL